MDRATVEALARSVGFRRVNIAPLTVPTRDVAAFAAWLSAGHHGSMGWMAESFELRTDPRRRLAQAASAIVLSLDHPHARPPRPEGLQGAVARYAWGRDYHNLIGKRLRKLRKKLDDAGVASWGGVDTAPVLERAWARLAGAGYCGKNTMLIRPGDSSWFFLAVLMVPLELEPDPPLGDHCGRCSRCLVACPTQAFPAPYVLDATRCIAYWTIEADDLAPEALLAGFGSWVFGCDVCQEVCPHNHDPPDADEDDLRPRFAWLDLPRWLAASDRDLLAWTEGTPLRRAAPHRLRRNALVVLGNLAVADPGRAAEVQAVALTHVDHPVGAVRAAARRALRVAAVGGYGLAGLAVGHGDSDPFA